MHTALGPEADPSIAAGAPALLAALRPLLGDRVSAGRAVREHHGRSEAWHHVEPPDLVAFPESTAEVAEIVRRAAALDVPVIPFGAGTSLEGNTSAPRGGISLDMGRMNRVLAVDAADLDCRVQPGLTRKQLNAQLGGTGLFFPIDPGADASIGGMSSTRASGTMAVRYGTMRDNVLGLEVVLADGRTIRTSRRARKSAAGYDLTKLFVGSEGTLGVITEITLRLHPLPEAVSAATCAFASLRDAVECVIATMQAGVPMARIELLDETMIRGVNLHSKLGQAERPTLFLEFHGSPAAVAEQVAAVEAIAAEHRGEGFRWADRPEDRSRLWHARDNTLYAGMALRPGARAMITDVCVPISRLADCLLETKRDIDASGLVVPIVGHVGDGNFHLLILVRPDDADEVGRARALHDAMVDRALAMDGTCTGEHGIGTGKIDFLEAELGDAVDVMRMVKRALDPRDLMNPGKIFRRAP
ncbi:MAG TPA: FAD-linked oxidase C-terminal domain-containing protein [Burkholderiaceae bacterium]|nr:FAD-linked oxidase C-terminal domain-containing protein [Burkholderiaceae bacterium]